MDIQTENDLFSGLKALADSAFPKHCKNCGRTFESLDKFLHETQPIQSDRSGLKQSVDDNDAPLVEFYRNCLCGSTLMDFFSDRRDNSPAGMQRREKFGKLMSQLVAHGWNRGIARTELLKILRGKRSELIEQLFTSRRQSAVEK